MRRLQKSIFIQKKLMDFLAKLEMGFQSFGEIHSTDRLAPGMPCSGISVRIDGPLGGPGKKGQELLAHERVLPTRRGEFVPPGQAEMPWKRWKWREGFPL